MYFYVRTLYIYIDVNAGKNNAKNMCVCVCIYIYILVNNYIIFALKILPFWHFFKVLKKHWIIHGWTRALALVKLCPCSESRAVDGVDGVYERSQPAFFFWVGTPRHSGAATGVLKDTQVAAKKFNDKDSRC